MKLPKGISYLVLALMVGLVATLLVHRYIVAKTAVVEKPKDRVVVATVEIEPGTAITSRMVTELTWPREIIPASAIRSTRQVEGRVAQTQISKGEAILPTRLAPEGTAAGLGGMLKPGCLAVTVRTDEVSGVAGFINPGDFVDVLMELAATEGAGEHYSKIILQGLKVLSKGQITEQSGEKKPQVVTTVTLEVTPEQAEVINLASFQGKIRLALRNQLHKEFAATKGVMTSQLITKAVALPPAPEKPQVQPAAKPQEEQQIEVIKGMQRSQKSL
jgi:pilus assembly protein CpaB